jgi:hypothetical protein
VAADHRVMTAATDPTHLPPPPPPTLRPAPRRWWAPVLFHGIGLIGTVVAGVAVVMAVALLAFVTSSCDPAHAQTGQLMQLRLGVVVLGVVLAAVPALWVLLAWGLRFAWMPWAVLAGGAIGVSLLTAVTTTHVGQWCF